MKKLREAFGGNALLFLNTETALTLLFRNLPEREPGMFVGVDARHVKRFGKVIERMGLKVDVFSGQKELGEVLQNERLLALIVPDNYEVFSRRYARLYAGSKALKVVYQNRKRPRSIGLEHDVYIWEGRQLPKTIGGSVMVFAKETLFDVRAEIKQQNAAFARMDDTEVIYDIRRALGGMENRFRRVDRRPPRILPRMLYDFYK